MTRPRRFYPVPPPTTSTDLSVTRPQPRPPKRQPGWEQRREAQAQTSAQAMAALTQMTAHLGGILDLMHAPPAGDVMGQLFRTIGASGYDTIQWPTPFSALTVANISPSLLLVAQGGPSAAGTPPTAGAGVFPVLGGIQRTVAARGNAVTIYGPPGSQYDITAYNRPRPPSSGECGSVAQPLSVTMNIGAGEGSSVAITPTESSLTAVVTDVAVTSASANTGTGLIVLSGITTGQLDYQLPESGVLDLDYTTPLLGTAPGASIHLAVATGAISGPYALSMSGFQR